MPHGIPARWLAVQTTNGAAAGVVMFDHPDNPRQPVKWYVSAEMPFASPAILFTAPLRMKPGDILKLRYALWIYDGVRTPAEIEAQWKKFAATRPRSE